MLGSLRLRVIASLCSSGAVAVSLSCTSSSPTASDGAADAVLDTRRAPDPDAMPATRDADPGGRSAGCGLCDAGKGSSHDAGRDGMTAPPPTTHLTGVTIAVGTATGTVTRTYDITVPTSCSAASPLPLIFAFHGDGGNGADMYQSFPIEQAALAAGGKAIFVYPDGTNDNIDQSGAKRAWDLYHDPGPFPYSAGDPLPAESDAPSGNVDVDFFDTMVKTFEQKYCVDPSRIFITGMSSGGFLSNQFARWRSLVVRGTAPQSGGAPFGNSDGTTSTASDWSPPNYCVGPTHAVPALIIHGAADTTVYPCNGVEAESYWDLANRCNASANNCTTQSDSSSSLPNCTGTNLAVPPPASTTTYGATGDCVQASGCSAPVVFCEIPGMGHAIWSEAPAVIWSFFSAL